MARKKTTSAEEQNTNLEALDLPESETAEGTNKFPEGLAEMVGEEPEAPLPETPELPPEDSGADAPPPPEGEPTAPLESGEGGESSDGVPEETATGEATMEETAPAETEESGGAGETENPAGFTPPDSPPSSMEPVEDAPDETAPLTVRLWNLRPPRRPKATGRTFTTWISMNWTGT